MSKHDDTTSVERPRSGSTERADAAEPSAFDPPTAADARFAERRELGRGGMGRVTEAHDIALGRDVAVKHMLSDDPVGLARFAREARITARLEHPSIVPLYDAGRNPDGTPFYVMRKVDGQPLDQLVEARDALADRLALVPNILAATDAVAYAHARGIVHRDIKPTNILVGAFGETLLIDWGLARESGGPSAPGEGAVEDAGIASSDVGVLTHAGAIAGTPGFMAPEQARGEEIDARADVFALGATLYFVLSRMPPYAASASGTAMIAQVAAEHPVDWTKLPAEVPIDLRAIVGKAMIPRREGRYADAGALAADLRRFIAGNLVGARDYGAFEQLRRWLRRHRAVVGVIGASAIILAIVATLAVRRVIAERDDARVARDLATAAQTLAERRQREALELADRQLIARAEALLGKDVISTITTLRELRPGSPSWSAAAALLEGTRLHGVPFGFTLDRHPVHTVMSPDSHYAFTLEVGGAISLIDLVRRTRTIIGAAPTRPLGAVWFGTDIAIVEGAQILRLDRTGALLETIAPPASTPIDYVHGSEDGAKLWVVAGTTIFALSGQPGERVWVPLIRDVESYMVDRALDQVLVVRKGRLVVWRAEHEQDLGPGTRIIMFTGRSDWFAMAQDNLVVRYEWRASSASYVKVGDWRMKQVLQLASAGKLLMAYQHGRTLNLTKDGGLWDLGLSSTAMMESEHGLVIVRDKGKIDLLETKHTSSLQWTVTPLHRVHWSRDGRFVMGISANKELVVWDRDSFQPRVMTLDATQNVVAYEQRTIWSMSPGVLASDNFETGVHTEKEIDGTMPVMRLSGNRRWIGALFGNNDARIQDLATGTIRRFAANDILPLEDGVILADGPNVRRFTDRVPDGEVVLTYPLAPDLVVHRPGHMVAAFGATLVEDDLTTHQRTELRAPGTIEYLAVSKLGEVFLIVEGRLHHVHDNTIAALDLPPPCVDVTWTNVSILVRCANAVFEVRGTTVRGIASNVRHWSASDRLLAFHRGEEQMVIVDRLSGMNIPLQAELGMSVELWNDGQHILVSSIVGTERLVREFRFAPAQNEVELRARLAAITNATANGGGVTWPDR